MVTPYNYVDEQTIIKLKQCTIVNKHQVIYEIIVNKNNTKGAFRIVLNINIRAASFLFSSNLWHTLAISFTFTINTKQNRFNRPNDQSYSKTMLPNMFIY